MSAGQLFDRLGVCELFPAFGQVTHIGAGEIEANGPEACVGACPSSKHLAQLAA
jgi:hypothetical protein